MRIIFYFVSFAMVFRVLGVQRPSYIQPCSESDPDLNNCIMKHANIALKELVNGDKTFKIPSLVPLKIDEVIIEPGDSLKLIMTKFQIFGLKHVQVIDADASIKPNRTIRLKLRAPRLEVIGNYDISGRIIILPLEGNGPCNITLENVIFTHDLEFYVKEIKGVRHGIMTKNIIKYDPGRVYFHFENLFNGDPRLGGEMLTFLNENWRDVNQEISIGITATIEAVVGNILENLFKVPYDDLILY